jgi:hypothetical protein
MFVATLSRHPFLSVLFWSWGVIEITIWTENFAPFVRRNGRLHCVWWKWTARFFLAGFLTKDRGAKGRSARHEKVWLYMPFDPATEDYNLLYFRAVQACYAACAAAKASLFYLVEKNSSTILFCQQNQSKTGIYQA